MTSRPSAISTWPNLRSPAASNSLSASHPRAFHPRRHSGRRRRAGPRRRRAMRALLAGQGKCRSGNRALRALCGRRRHPSRRRCVRSRDMRLAFVAIGLVLLVADQITKYWALEGLSGRGVIEVTSFFNLVLVWNTGVSFGMFAGSGEFGRWALVALATLVGAGLVVWFLRERRNLPRLSIAMILSGAIGNVIDRTRFGAVVDFLDFHAMGYHWPAFNIADTAIVVGAILLLMDGLFFSEKTPDENEAR
ncbi:MAG: signal peptidase II [Geminicoccaceae bacterium]